MGKYVTMITTANKTLEKKCSILKSENQILLKENEVFKRKVYELEHRINILERNKCKQQELCLSLKNSILPMGFFLDAINSLE